MKTAMALALVALAMTACVEAPDNAGEAGAAAAETDRGDAAQAGLTPDTTLGPDAIEIVSAGGDVRFDPACLINTDGAAGIAMPETLGDFVSAFPAGTMLSFYPTYMVDFGKLCLRAGGEDALCADFESYNVEVYHPDIAVVGLSVYAPQCRTAEGIGPGSSVAETVEAYGAPTFSFNYDNEGREYVGFAGQPEGLAFRARSDSAEAAASSTGVPNGPYAGNYEGVDGDGSYFETSDYYPDAEIWEVFISAPFEPIE